MAAHPGVSIASSLVHQPSALATTSVGVRHRYLTRRRRSATAATRMAAATGDGGGSERGGGGGGRRNSRGSSSSSSSSSGGGGGGGSGGGGGGDMGTSNTTAPGSSETQLPRPPDGIQVGSVNAKGAQLALVYGGGFLFELLFRVRSETCCLVFFLCSTVCG